MVSAAEVRVWAQATVCFGLYLSKKAPYAMNEQVRHSVHVVFQEIAHFTETHIFVLAGLIICDLFILKYGELTGDIASSADTDDAVSRLSGDQFSEQVTAEVGQRLFYNYTIGYHMAMSIALYAALHIIRASIIMLGMPVLRKIGYGLTVKEGLMMVWSGLRGAVSLCMALIVFEDTAIDQVVRDLIFFHTASIVTFTIVINGSTAGWVYNQLDMYPANSFRHDLRSRGLKLLALEVGKIMREISKSWFHMHAHDDTLQRLLPDYRASRFRYGIIHLQGHESIEKVFFGEEV